jgi:hypothetical protein
MNAETSYLSSKQAVIIPRLGILYQISMISKLFLDGSIPDGVTEFFIDVNHYDRTMALGSTQTLTEMSTKSISWG